MKMDRHASEAAVLKDYTDMLATREMGTGGLIEIRFQIV
jgi:hypothetical protein